MLNTKLLPTLIFTTLTTTFLLGCGEQKTNNTAEPSTASASQIVDETPPNETPDANAIENSPIDQVFKKVKDLNDFRILDIRQEFNTPESGKTEAKVILTKEGLADDSVEAERVKYDFKFIDGQWKEIRKEETWRCGRGPDTKNFTKKLCP
ncbi:hypothetical protein G9F32_08460 [Acinetobacter sp. 194]|uniref:hypothetical protein n=1 Tax=Acinetobacter shaoyimingii TaxID=2715164 RepID=UPI00140BEECC|nr:hypothetical protein [Acinetobacter shaoyimingii]NHB58053.1 hypothetical protein [Acinetobacter shaoyimingii]